MNIQKNLRKVCPGIEKIKKIFEKDKSEKVSEKAEPDRVNNATQIRTTFEKMMDKNKRQETEKEEKRREILKKERKIKRKINLEKKRISQQVENIIIDQALTKNNTGEKSERKKCQTRPQEK